MNDFEFYRRILEMLERIAIALEFEKKQRQSETEIPFPWDDSRLHARIRDATKWNPGKYDPQDRVRPETFEALIRFGRRAIIKGVKNLGEITVATIDPVMAERGYEKQWMNS